MATGWKFEIERYAGKKLARARYLVRVADKAKAAEALRKKLKISAESILSSAFADADDLADFASDEEITELTTPL